MHPRNTFIQLTAIGLALATTPKLLSETLSLRPVLVQSPVPTAFPLPSSLPSGTVVKVDGSTSMKRINEALKQRFAEQFSGSSVELAANGTDKALQDLIDGRIALASVGRPLTADEKTKGLVEVPISRAKIAIIVGPENPFSGDVTFEQFAKIFRGEITDWSQLGGQPGPIRFVDRPDFSDTRQSLKNYAVFKSAPFKTGSNATQVTSDETSAVIQQLGKDGISYTVADQVLGQSDVKIVPMHQTLPDDPRYPFSQPRGFVYKEGANPGTLAFLGFVTSPAGQAAVQAAVSAEASMLAGVESTAPNSLGAVGSSGTAGAAAGTAGTGNSSGTTNSTSTGSPDAAVAPSAAGSSSSATTGSTSSTTNAQVTQAPARATTAEGRGGLPPWLWWLGLPILGGLLWWFLKGRQPGAAGITAMGTTAAPAPVAPVVPPVRSIPESRMVLTPRDCRHAYAYWEVPEARFAELHDQGGRKKAVRLYDVTGININDQVPHSVKQFDCSGNDPDLHLPITTDNRDYIAELGYVTDEGRWLKVVRSPQVHVPACVPATAPDVSTAQPQVAAKIPTPNLGGAAVATGAVLAGGAALAGAAFGAAGFAKDKAASQSRIVLTPRDGQNAYAYWEVPDAEKAALKQRGGQQFALRLHDVTGLNLENPLSPAVQQISCNEADQDQHLSLPAADRDYLAEIGYSTPDGQWLSLARSNTVRISPTDDKSTDQSTGLGGLGAVGAGLAGGATIAAVPVARSISSDSRPPEIERSQDSGSSSTVAPSTIPSHGLGAAAGAVAAGTVAASAMTAGAIPAPTGRCAIKNFTVHAVRNCVLLDDAKMQLLQNQTAVTKVLQPGTHLVRIKSGAFGYGTGAEQSEPIVLLWIQGGRVINQKTNVPVTATWSTLNGYDDTLTLKVEEATTLHAFFFDTHLEDNEGEVTLSVISLPY